MPGNLQLFSLDFLPVMRIEGGRGLNDEGDRPYYLISCGVEWTMTLDAARDLGLQAWRIAYRLREAREAGEPVQQVRAYFRRPLTNPDGSDASPVELGMAQEDGGVNVYFLFRGRRLLLPVTETGADTLIGAFQLFRGDVRHIGGGDALGLPRWA